MTRTFHNLKSEYIEEVSYWFWYRESWTVLWSAFKDWQSKPPPWAFRCWAEVFIGFPLAFIYILLFGSHVSRSYARKCIKHHIGLKLCNQKNIEYFTIIERLTGYTDGYQ